MTEQQRLDELVEALRRTHSSVPMSEEHLRRELQGVIAVANRVLIDDPPDVLRLAQLMIFAFAGLASDLRREYFLNVLNDLEVAPDNRLKMLELITKHDDVDI